MCTKLSLRNINPPRQSRKEPSFRLLHTSLAPLAYPTAAGNKIIRKNDYLAAM